MSKYSKNDVLKSLEIIFRDLFLDDHIDLTEATSPADIAEWDSLAHVSLLAAVEREFGVHFTADEMSRINDVSTMLVALRERGI